MDLKKNTYHELIEDFGADKIQNRFIYLKMKANDFITESGYSGLVECNERILMHVVVDYFADIQRLKGFHNLAHIKTEKITAYTAAWILKRKPLQFVKTIEEERDIFVNERFAMFLVIKECMGSEDTPVLKKDDLELFDNYLELLLYHLKYRECNPQVIELVIESFKMGCFVYRKNVRNRV